MEEQACEWSQAELIIPAADDSWSLGKQQSISVSVGALSVSAFTEMLEQKGQQ